MAMEQPSLVLRRCLVVYNISKRNNIKDLCWTAAAHNFEVLYVSASNLEGDQPHASF
jgi:hypothetical protein